jgi:ABC-type glycerol-3-phosphate transport system permease component
VDDGAGGRHRGHGLVRHGPHEVPLPPLRLRADYDLIDTKLSLILAMVTVATPYALWVLSDATVYSIPPVVLYYAFKRYLVNGLVSGAVSGT